MCRRVEQLTASSVLSLSSYSVNDMAVLFPRSHLLERPNTTCPELTMSCQYRLIGIHFDVSIATL